MPTRPCHLRLSIAAPAYNEAAGIAHVVESWLDHLRAGAWAGAFEIVVCDDGSADATRAVLNRLAAEHPEIRPIGFARNQGAAAALAAAITATRGDWVLLMDSDGQWPIEDLERLAAAAQGAATSVAIGVRAAKEGGLFARAGSAASAAVCNAVFGSRCRDFNSAFKLVDGSLLRSLALEARGLNYSTEITAKLLERGVVPAEVEVIHRPRAHGRSSMRALRGARDRLLFVLHLAFRRLLQRAGVLRVPS